MKRYHKDTKKFFLAISSAFSDKKKSRRQLTCSSFLRKDRTPEAPLQPCNYL